MVDPPKNDKQLALYREMSRIKQGWTVLWFVLACVASLTIAFLFCLFQHQKAGPTTISGLLDGVFGWCLRAIIKFHFPSSGSDEDKGFVGNILSKL
jgi:hypothetical protein